MADIAAMTAQAGGKYAYARGRRKTATATVKLWLGGKGKITANGRELKDYFGGAQLPETVVAPLRAVGLDKDTTIELRLSGGGSNGQAEAARHGISRALLVINPTYRSTLKQNGFLTRDPREKERKKYGFKKARKGSQWAKR